MHRRCARLTLKDTEFCTCGPSGTWHYKVKKKSAELKPCPLGQGQLHGPTALQPLGPCLRAATGLTAPYHAVPAPKTTRQDSGDAALHGNWQGRALV